MFGIDRARRTVAAAPVATATVHSASDSRCRASHGSDFLGYDTVLAGSFSGGMDTCQGDSDGLPLTGGVLAGSISRAAAPPRRVTRGRTPGSPSRAPRPGRPGRSRPEDS
ncbi:hypothetical protein ADL25_22395 [Streptomyces sp. NRRL F-5122]|uniref:hypothetical protein n=1 Tax=unclassified Streptomyces TaxID=2593676 RepID=UPI000740F8DA|nr:hypothetical protein ADL25_22395 [Streptomyces sp. NRRL F-5122]